MSCSKGPTPVCVLILSLGQKLESLLDRAHFSFVFFWSWLSFFQDFWLCLRTAFTFTSCTPAWTWTVLFSLHGILLDHLISFSPDQRATWHDVLEFSWTLLIIIWCLCNRCRHISYKPQTDCANVRMNSQHYFQCSVLPNFLGEVLILLRAHHASVNMLSRNIAMYTNGFCWKKMLMVLLSTHEFA